jgi:hypothetical protein
VCVSADGGCGFHIPQCGIGWVTRVGFLQCMYCVNTTAE